MQTAWRLSSFQSSVKELIPEFYFLPEFLRNNEGKSPIPQAMGSIVLTQHLSVCS